MPNRMYLYLVENLRKTQTATPTSLWTLTACRWLHPAPNCGTKDLPVHTPRRYSGSWGIGWNPEGGTGRYLSRAVLTRDPSTNHQGALEPAVGLLHAGPGTCRLGGSARGHFQGSDGCPVLSAVHVSSESPEPFLPPPLNNQECPRKREREGEPFRSSPHSSPTQHPAV